MPIALIAEKMKSDRLLTTVIGSPPVAKAVVLKQTTQSVRTLHTDIKIFARLEVSQRFANYLSRIGLPNER